MEQVLTFILSSIAHFISALDFPIFSNGITYLQFILSVPIIIALIKLLTFGFTQFVNKSDFSLFDNMRNNYVDREVTAYSNGGTSVKETRVNRKSTTVDYYARNGSHQRTYKWRSRR